MFVAVLCRSDGRLDHRTSRLLSCCAVQGIRIILGCPGALVKRTEAFRPDAIMDTLSGRVESDPDEKPGPTGRSNNAAIRIICMTSGNSQVSLIPIRRMNREMLSTINHRRQPTSKPRERGHHPRRHSTSWASPISPDRSHAGQQPRAEIGDVSACVLPCAVRVHGVRGEPPLIAVREDPQRESCVVKQSWPASVAAL